MPAATNHSDGRGPQSSVQVYVCDPVLVVVYFFNGADTCASVAEERLSAVFDTLAEELDVHQPFQPAISHADVRSIDFARYQWNSESLATLLQLRVKPSQVWCIQLALPVRIGSISCEEALAAWQELGDQLGNWLGDLTDASQRDGPVGAEELYWGTSRLYWALSDEIAGTTGDSLELARAVRSIAYPELSRRACPESGRRASPSKIVQGAVAGAAAGSSPIHCQAYDPQGHTGDYGMLWRLDEPAAEAGPYQAAWLLVSPQAQNDAVVLGYVLNGRFAVGEAYLCKAHYQAGQYTLVAQDLKDDIKSVQQEIMELLALEGPSGFAPDQIGEARDNLRSHGGQIHQVAVAYSHLLFALSIIDRLHLTVKTNLDNFEQMAAEFNLWDHPASQSEIVRLQGVLRQIEHDQHSRRASLRGFQTAIETVRARLDLIDDGISAARLEMEQEEAKRLERWNIIVAILGVVLGVSQVVVLTRQQLGVMVLLSGLLFLVLFLLLRRLPRAGKRRE